MNFMACASSNATLKGRKFGSDGDAIDLIGQASQHGASLIAIPTARLREDFFRLSSRVAGEFLQKFVMYGVRVAIVGDVSRQVSESKAFRDFVIECNRGRHVWFLTDLEKLESLLRPSCTRKP